MYTKWGGEEGGLAMSNLKLFLPNASAINTLPFQVLVAPGGFKAVFS